jgi:4-amino-4-deoxy-L-arabinose transferase-like glycosyltransferase
MSNAIRSAAGPAPSPARGEASTDIAALIAVSFCLLFFLESLVFIPYVGLQNDELLFASTLFPPVAAAGGIQVGHHEIETMIMSYVGTLKSWLYEPVFALWAPSPWSVRLPVALLGALTVGLFFRLVRRSSGRRAALAATALLATDATFVLTGCMDWGPVVLQRLLLVSGLLLLVVFHGRPRALVLAAAFCAFGLALWDKALFSWSLTGLLVAAVVVFPHALRRHLSLRNLAAAAAGFAIGAAPLAAFNVNHRFATFRANASFDGEHVARKFAVLRSSLEGGVLFGYMVREDAPLQPGKPQDALESSSLALSEALERPHAGLLALAFVVAFALLPWFWHSPARQPMLFSLVFMAVTWIQMALTNGAGTGAHHAVLLWPFPHLFVGAAFARASQSLKRAGPVALGLVIAAICASNLAVLNQHLAQLIERGTTTIWTDAIGPLAEDLDRERAGRIFVMDWGMMNVLRAVGEGRLPLQISSDLASRNPIPPSDQALALRMLAEKNALFIEHTDGNEIFAGNNTRFAALAEEAGYGKEVLKTIADRNGRAVFELCRWKPRMNVKE